MIPSYNYRDDFKYSKTDLEKVMLDLAIVEFIVTFSAAMFTCQVTCCDRRDCFCPDIQQGNKIYCLKC